MEACWVEACWVEACWVEACWVEAYWVEACWVAVFAQVAAFAPALHQSERWCLSRAGCVEQREQRRPGTRKRSRIRPIQTTAWGRRVTPVQTVTVAGGVKRHIQSQHCWNGRTKLTWAGWGFRAQEQGRRGVCARGRGRGAGVVASPMGVASHRRANPLTPQMVSSIAHRQRREMMLLAWGVA